MGCGGSTEKGSRSPVNGGVIASPYDRRPKISVRIGQDVRRLERTPRVVFIFGGPGSRKGRIVDDLKNSYGFRHICTEEIIYQEFPRKVANIMKLETANEIKEALETDPSHISAQWVMSMIERTIERESQQTNTFLVDYIPNLKYLLKIDTLLHDVDDCLAHFEEKYPISFAMNLAVPSDKVLKAKQVYCATPEAKEKMKETGGQGDEADSGRIQRRAQLFSSTVKHFIDYFAKRDRLVTVDVTCGIADLIWHRVHELLCELEFSPHRTVNTVLLFAFDEQDAADIDYEKYVMEKLYLQKVVDNPSASVENLLKSLSKHVDESCEKSDSFVVIMSGTSITRDAVLQLTKKLIMFAEIDRGTIEKYLPGSPKNYIPHPNAQTYKAVCSVENEICLFPTSANDDVCKCIASLMMHARLL